MIQLPPSDTEFSGTYQRRGYYQRQSLMQAFAYVRHWRAAVDIGAHVGFMSLDMAKLFQKVYAFEPVLENFECLCANTPNNVHVYPVALSDGWHSKSFHNPTPHNSGAWEMVDGDMVVTATLDSYQIGDVDLIKIDTQGCEAEILAGAVETIAASKPIIMVEIMKDGIPNKAVDEIMERMGYAFQIQRGKDAVFAPAGKVLTAIEYV